MVSRSTGHPGSIPTLLLAWLVAIVPATARADGPDADAEARSALAKGGFPWYDEGRDRVVVPAEPWRPKMSLDVPILGDVLAALGFAVGLAVLVVGLLWLWRNYRPSAGAEAGRPGSRPGAPARVEALADGLGREFESTDPWAEALRRRERGDRIGSIVCLFAHQLITLSKLGLLRLAPGRTGRQLVRSVADAEFRDLVRPTLRAFEAAYYGQKGPTAEEFAAVWADAEAFERRVARGVAS